MTKLASWRLSIFSACIRFLRYWLLERESTGHQQRLVTWSFDVFFGVRLNKRLSKRSRCRWFETPWRLLWRHCDVVSCIIAFTWCLWSLVSPTHLECRTWISNYIHCCLRDVTNHPCYYFNVGLAKPPMKLRYGWVITYHDFILM